MRRTILAAALVLACAGAARADTLYTNGPVNGALPGSPGSGEAWTINFGFVVSDSFTLSANGTITGFDFSTWNPPGDEALQSIDWSIGSAVYGTDLAFGTATAGNALGSAFIATNNYGYGVNLNTVAGLDLLLGAGTYWITLSNAVVTSGDPVYWDENDGASQAYENTIGSLTNANGNCANGAQTCTGSETFNIYGTQGEVPEPGSLALLGAGLLALGLTVHRRDRVA